MKDKSDIEEATDRPAFLLLDLTSEIPLYQQIRDQIVVAMAEGRLPDGTALPTTHKLAQDFGINFHTVNKAYDLLRQEGFVSLTRRQGSCVQRASTAEPHLVKDWQGRLRTLLAEAVARGMSPESILNECLTILDTFPHPNKPQDEDKNLSSGSLL
jgi:DNA-binding transcriptional regulator YhcF (GntR family)